MPRSNIVHEAHRVRIHDMQPIQSPISLNRQGFALLEQRSAVRDFWDEDEIRRVYYPGAERFISATTGASRVFIFDHTLRRRIPGAIDHTRDVPRQPATRVHVDHTAKSGPQRVHELMGEDAEELLPGRVQVINLWRPIHGPLRDAPLAVCDASTVAAADLVPSDLVYRDRLGETYSVTYNPATTGTSLVLRAGNAGARGSLVEVLRHHGRRARALHASLVVHRHDDPARRGAARKHRAAHARLRPGLTVTPVPAKRISVLPVRMAGRPQKAAGLAVMPPRLPRHPTRISRHSCGLQ